MDYSSRVLMNCQRTMSPAPAARPRRHRFRISVARTGSFTKKETTSPSPPTMKIRPTLQPNAARVAWKGAFGDSMVFLLIGGKVWESNPPGTFHSPTLVLKTRRPTGTHTFPLSP